jgi:D-3-phosphoglycerate dehydrogenase
VRHCFVTQPIHPDGVARLESAGIGVRFASAADMAAVGREIGDAVAVITRDLGIDAAAIRAAPRLRLIASHGIGTNRIDLVQAAHQGVLVTNTPGTNVQSVAEHAIGLMLALSRRVTEADHAVRTGEWEFRHASGLAELRGRRLGLAGFGAIAQAVARIAQAGFGMEVVAWSPRTSAALFEAASVRPSRSLRELLATSDVVSLHRPLRDDTVHMIDDEALAAIKRGALLINTGRGALIDIAALRCALDDGRVAAAALDVFASEPPAADDPVMRLPHTILTPHLGGATQDALRATAVLCAQQVIAALSGATPMHIVQHAD